MSRLKRRFVTGGAIAVFAAGTAVATPVAAFANPTNEVYTTYAACEARAATIRDGITGAECKPEASGWPPRIYWRLYVYN
ncbi:hypothetical protein [Kribbella sp. NPDC055071]